MKTMPPETFVVQSAPDVLDREWSELIDGPLTAPGPATPGQAQALGSVRGRLVRRVASSHRAEAGMVTVRRRTLTPCRQSDGYEVRQLYAAEPDAVLRGGEPWLALMVRWQPGAALDVAALLGPDVAIAQALVECVLLQGGLCMGGPSLDAGDYHVSPVVTASSPWVAGPSGAQAYVRLSPMLASEAPRATTVPGTQVPWVDFAPGVRRRLLHVRPDGQSAALFQVEAGATLAQHAHDHDEECLMVQGELFLDDVLLQAGDYQLAQRGSAHHCTHTDTGAILFVHGAVHQHGESAPNPTKATLY